MIELNLIPEELRKKRARIELPEIPLVPIAVAAVGALVVLQFALGSIIYLSQKQLAGLDKKWESLLPKKIALDKIKEEIAAVGEKVTAVEGLIKKQVHWSRLLNELSNSLTANIWITKLFYEESPGRYNKTRTLTLQGSAAGKSEEATSLIARFIEALKENKNFFADFDTVELISIREGQVAGQDVMNFTLACSFKSPETPEEEENA
jgi:Tfp pilus assembly protein PilN